MALILAAVTLLLTSCTHGKQSKQEELYGALEASQGKVYSAQVIEYIGTTMLHVNCRSVVAEAGMKENTRSVIKTYCDQEILAYAYSAYIPVTQNGENFFLPVNVYSYVPLQTSDYPQSMVGDTPASQVAVEARLDVSPFTYYSGPGEWIFMAGIEADTEVLQHLPPGEWETLSQPEGKQDRP